jgi:phospholipid/cholesterol/gamma-HCH transport system ATP-binding protein
MIKIQSVSKQFNSHPVLDHVSFDVPDRKVMVILGTSGIGKSVLLRIMTGLLVPDSGYVSYEVNGAWYRLRGGRNGNGSTPDAERASPPTEAATTPARLPVTDHDFFRQLGFVFQGGALFDSLSVADNVALPLRERERMSRKEVNRRVAAALTTVGMAEHARLFPRELSGGMSRLVAIARAIVSDPQYLFFDEPTTGLDPVMKERICNLIANLRDEHAKTEIVVTHDLEAVQAIADEILMLHDARVVPLDHASKEDYETINT